MQKNATLLSGKLKSYSLMAGSLLGVSSNAGAQILHQNISDTTYTDSETGLSFDLNNDGITDFTFFLIKSGTSPSVNQFVGGFASNVDNEIAGSVGTNNYVYPFALEAGNQIGADLEWQPYGSLFWIFGQHYSSGGGTPVQAGNWLGREDRFAGLRIEADEHKYYGWIRMSIDTLAGQFTIKDFALQTTADSAIVAGDTDVISGVPQAILDHRIRIHSYERDVFISVPATSEDDMAIELINMTGMVVDRRRTNQREVHMKLSDYPDGIYLVSVEWDGVRAIQKIALR